MKKELAKLNFNKIVMYENINGYKNDFPYKCDGFCIDCEEKKLLKRGEKLITISHGADSHDYKKLIKKEYSNNIPVMIVFENPGGNINYGDGWVEKCTFKNITKFIPINHYYWVNDEIKNPITSIDEVIKFGIYDPYIVYLCEKYNLNNIYVTNLTKCKFQTKNEESVYADNGNYSKIKNNCIEHLFKKELDIFTPEIVLCMGSKVYNWFPCHLVENRKNIRIFKLLHPKARMNLKKLFSENDKILRGVFKKSTAPDKR